MLGFEEDEIGNTFEDWQKRLHPDDRLKTVKAIDNYLKGITKTYMI
ncbi:MAG: PAS domain-containing protein [Okeania sp. SIO3C4]|nr:PAS domain-containing protein [Okeania sp. SIO3C4]